MLLAELEIRHSRAAVPTRRVALGLFWLPTNPAPGFGGLLLAGIVGALVGCLDDEDYGELAALVNDLCDGRRIAQPRLRHRFQTDVVGLDRSRHKLVGRGESLTLELDEHGRPIPQILGAVYAASLLHPAARPLVFSSIRRALLWDGEGGPELLEYLTDPSATSTAAWRRFPADERWALEVLGFDADTDPEPDAVRHRFRRLIREAHPDHGARSDGAGLRIVELTEARRILIG